MGQSGLEPLRISVLTISKTSSKHFPGAAEPNFAAGAATALGNLMDFCSWNARKNAAWVRYSGFQVFQLKLKSELCNASNGQRRSRAAKINIKNSSC